MTTHGLAALVTDRSSRRRIRPSSRGERRMIPVRNEADFLTVRLFRNAETQASRVIAHLGLVHRPKWEAGPGQLFLRQPEQEVRLILFRIETACQAPASIIVAPHAGVVSRGNLF